MKNNPYTKELKCIVFDIETSGLYPGSSGLISASFIDPDGSGLFQLFAESPADEKRIAEEIYNKISGLDVVIGYNSNRFDVPFVINRLKHYGIAEKLPPFWSVDVYHWLKHYWPLAKSMEHLRQKDVEEALGINTKRTDLIDGGECIELYSRYISLKDQKAKDDILLHNADDVRQLARITQKLNFLPYHKIAYENGFYIKERKTKISRVKMTKRGFETRAYTLPGTVPASIFGDEYELECDTDGKILLRIFTQNNNGQLFTDLKKLPVAESLFTGCAGYHSGYLVLYENDEPMYRELNELNAALIRTIL